MYGDLFVVRWKKGSFPAAFKNIITMVVLVVSVLFLMKGILDINITSLIATTTVLTATIGLAFQSTLANMLAGLTIHLEKPLRQGDWVTAGGHEGNVLDITLRSTRMRTIENNEIFIPNSQVLSGAVVNYSQPDHMTIRKVAVGVSYHVEPNTVRRAVREVLAAVAGVHSHPEPQQFTYIWGPFLGKYHFWVGDSVRKGYVYWNKVGDISKSHPLTSLTSVSDPGEVLQNGFIFSSVPFVFSKLNLYALDYGATDALPEFTSRLIPIGMGLAGKWAFAVGSTMRSTSSRKMGSMPPTANRENQSPSRKTP